ncbi:MAG: MoaD/ThiS family protein [Chloroflexi bacterium]|nr:MoaD/ThiS family protein [Chloroflexota bacterium]
MATICVRVQLRGQLRRYVPPAAGGWISCRLPAGTTIAGLARALGFADDEEFDGAVGERIGRLDDVLRDGDEIILFPPLAGGQ